MRLHRCGFPPAIAQHHNGLVASVVQVQEQVPEAWVSKKGYVVERSAQPRAHAYPGATWRQNSCLLSSSNMQQEQEQQEQRQQQQVVELWLLLSSLLLELWRRGVAGVAEGSQGCRRCVTPPHRPPLSPPRPPSPFSYHFPSYSFLPPHPFLPAPSPTLAPSPHVYPSPSPSLPCFLLLVPS